MLVIFQLGSCIRKVPTTSTAKVPRVRDLMWTDAAQFSACRELERLNVDGVKALAGVIKVCTAGSFCHCH